MNFDFMLVIAGALTGTLVGMTGVGGGAVMTPILLLVFGVAPTTAVGTDLLVAAVTKTVASRMHHARGLIEWQVVRRMWIGALPASAITVAIIATHPADKATTDFLKSAIAYAVLVTAVAMLFQRKLHDIGQNLRTGAVERFKAAQLPITILGAVVLGTLVTLTSVGAGSLGVVFLTFLYPLRLTPPRLVATDIVYAIPVSLFAGLGHLMVGNVNFGLMFNLLCGSIPGVLLGAWLSTRLPHKWLRVALSIILLITAGKLLMSA